MLQGQGLQPGTLCVCCQKLMDSVTSVVMAFLKEGGRTGNYFACIVMVIQSRNFRKLKGKQLDSLCLKRNGIEMQLSFLLPKTLLLHCVKSSILHYCKREEEPELEKYFNILRHPYLSLTTHSLQVLCLPSGNCDDFQLTYKKCTLFLSKK